MMKLAQNILLSLPPEVAHNVAISGLAGLGRLPGPIEPLSGRKVDFLGHELSNPIGLAAGLDKDAQAVLGLAKVGFGFVEVGTVTPKPQPGNPKPRLFRLKEHAALINRMGFNNQGVEAMAGRLERVRNSGRLDKTLVGINLGKNKDTPLEGATEDYLIGMRRMHSLADYFTLNLSSPNTPGLRQLQHGDALAELLGRVKEAQQTLANGRAAVPILLKVAPDLDDEDIESISTQLVQSELEGLIATNTTLARTAVRGHVHAEEVGGLSGAPLTGKSAEVVRKFRARLPLDMPIVGVGGVSCPESAREMFTAGASVLQIYTSFIYKGPRLVQELTNDSLL
ncbi:MAG: quinone-dependent dihydroorotate dehydrogenase [Pseudomonadales bacterium]|nr:quinone-dependent dihydroorotate dehydrogenase [Pseudomonadales bacterium]